MKCKIRILSFALVLCISPLSLSFAQSQESRYPHRIITAEDINKAGDDRFKMVLHYLMPDLFPKTDQAWYNTTSRITFYVDDDKCEQDELDELDPQQVKRIVIWEKRWEPSPMSYPDLAYSRYVVRIETI